MYSNLGTAYYQAREYKSAQENIKLASSLITNSDHTAKVKDQRLQLYKNIATLSNKIGNIHFMQGDYDSALSTYQEAHKMIKVVTNDEDDPTLLLIQHNIALVHVRKGELDDALIELKSIKKRQIL